MPDILARVARPLPLLALSCIGTLAGCGLFPEVSPFVSNRSTLAKTRIEENGVIAFIRDQEDLNLDIKVDVRNLSTGKKYRIDFDPPFFNYVFFLFNGTQLGTLDRKLQRNVISDSVALFALPEGEYEPLYSVVTVMDMGRLMRGDTRQDMSSYRSPGARFTVEPGKVTSFGRIRVDFKQAFLKKTVLNVYSSGVAITDEIRAVSEIGASSWEIRDQEFRASYQ